MTKFFIAVARVLAVGVLMAATGLTVAQQTYPTKPVRFIVPYAPGGSVSVVGRLIGQRLTEGWGQQVIVDNRPGGNTIIGSEALVKSKRPYQGCSQHRKCPAVCVTRVAHLLRSWSARF